VIQPYSRTAYKLTTDHLTPEERVEGCGQRSQANLDPYQSHGVCVPKTSSALIRPAKRASVSGDGRATLLRPELVGFAFQVDEPA
jgi:hypothetical protein